MNSLIGIVFITAGVFAIYFDRPKPEPKEWRTLVIWRSDDWKVTQMSWFSGAHTKEQVEGMGSVINPTGFKVMEAITVPGGPVSAEWVQSLPRS